MSWPEQRLVPDDGQLWSLLRQSEQLLSGLALAAEDSAGENQTAWQFPAPLADRRAVEALDRVRDALAEQLSPPGQQDTPSGCKLIAPDGRHEHTPLRLVPIAQADLTVLEAALQVCSHATLHDALIPIETTDQITDLREALEGIELDSQQGPPREQPLRGAAALAGLARLVAVLDLTPNADTQLLTDAVAEPGNIVLTDAQEAAYQRVTTRITALISDGDPLHRWQY